jgi:hypothetical protein
VLNLGSVFFPEIREPDAKLIRELSVGAGRENELDSISENTQKCQLGSYVFLKEFFSEGTKHSGVGLLELNDRPDSPAEAGQCYVESLWCAAASLGEEVHAEPFS